MQAALTSISNLFDARGSLLGEAVAQLEHGLLADGTDKALVVTPSIAGHSRVNSSTIVSIRNDRPSAVRSITKS